MVCERAQSPVEFEKKIQIVGHDYCYYPLCPIAEFGEKLKFREFCAKLRESKQTKKTFSQKAWLTKGIPYLVMFLILRSGLSSTT